MSSVLTTEITKLRRLEREVLREQKVLAVADAALTVKQEEITQMTAAKRAAFEDVNADAESLRQRAETLGEKADTIRELIAALETSVPGAPRLKPRSRMDARHGPAETAIAVHGARYRTTSRRPGVRCMMTSKN